jgi:hypothetical protein
MTAAETTLAGVATDANLTTLTNRVTAVEGVNTTQSTNITNNTNSITTINSTLTGYVTSITTGALTTSAASTSTPVGVTITQSTNANSKRAAIQLGSGWVVGQDSSTSTSGGVKDFFIYDATASAYRLKIGTDGIISTISSLKLRPGTATAGTAPLYFDTVSPVLLTSPVAGAMEYDGTNLYFTPSGVSRKTVAYLDSSITGNAATATRATNVAGGVAKQIPIQSAANTTTFIGESVVNSVLVGTSSPPYAAWQEPVPYRMQAGKETSVLGGGATHAAITVIFDVPFDHAPVITATATGTSTPTSVTVSSITTDSFVIYIFAGTGTNNSVWGASTTARTIHWTAVQYSSTSAVS